jgi:hypothetical protein
MLHMSRRQLLETGMALLVLPGSQKHISAEVRLRLTETISSNIVNGWRLFHEADNRSLLSYTQSQLFLLQQAQGMVEKGAFP